MDKNPLSKGVLTEHGIGIGVVTKKMIRERAVELAVINGRSAHEVSKLDWEQAKRELSGGPETDRQTAILESIPESARWDPTPGDPGRQIAESASEDEDEEGRSETEQLVEEGVQEAARDQSLAAALEAEKQEKNQS